MLFTLKSNNVPLFKNVYVTECSFPPKPPPQLQQDDSVKAHPHQKPAGASHQNQSPTSSGGQPEPCPTGPSPPAATKDSLNSPSWVDTGGQGGKGRFHSTGIARSGQSVGRGVIRCRESSHHYQALVLWIWKDSMCPQPRWVLCAFGREENPSGRSFSSWAVQSWLLCSGSGASFLSQGSGSHRVPLFTTHNQT